MPREELGQFLERDCQAGDRLSRLGTGLAVEHATDGEAGVFSHPLQIGFGVSPATLLSQRVGFAYLLLDSEKKESSGAKTLCNRA